MHFRERRRVFVFGYSALFGVVEIGGVFGSGSVCIGAPLDGVEQQYSGHAGQPGRVEWACQRVSTVRPNQSMARSVLQREALVTVWARCVGLCGCWLVRSSNLVFGHVLGFMLCFFSFFRCTCLFADYDNSGHNSRSFLMILIKHGLQDVEKCLYCGFFVNGHWKSYQSRYLVSWEDNLCPH